MKLKRFLGTFGVLTLLTVPAVFLIRDKVARPAPVSEHSGANAAVVQAAPQSMPARTPIAPDLFVPAPAPVPVPPATVPPASLEGGRATADPVRERSFASFNGWLTRYQAADAAGRAALEPEGVALAQTRLTAFADLMQADPRRALQLALAPAERSDLPDAVLAWLEKPVNVRGDFAVMGTLPLPGQKPELPAVFRTATIQGETHHAYTFGQALGYLTRKQVPLNGYSVASSAASRPPHNPLVWAGRMLLLNPNPVRVLAKSEVDSLAQAKGADVVCSVSGASWTANSDERAAEIAGQVFTFCGASHLKDWSAAVVAAAGLETPSGAAGDAPIAQSSYTEGRKRMLLMRPYWSDHAVAMTTNSALTHWVNFSNYMWQMSYGKLVFAPLGQGSDISTELLIPGSVNDYTAGLGGGAGQAWQAVRDVASTNYGYNLGNYDFIYYVTDGLPSASYCGLGFVGGVGFHLANNCFDAAVSSHEYGHNLGLNHAHFWDTALASIVGVGSNVEYGDGNDPMGGGGNPNQYNSRYKNYLGWITNTDIVTIPSVSSNRYRLYCFDLDYGVGLRGLKFASAGTDHDNYWINFRQRKTSAPALMNGVQLLWTGNNNRGSYLLDVRLKGGSSDNAVVIGRTFSDPIAAFHFTPIGKGNTYPESMDVVVVTGAQPGNLPPSAVLSASTLTPSPGQAVAFSASASDPNGDTLAYYWEFGDGADSYSSDNKPVQTHSFSSAGEYAVRCVVSDMRGGTAQHTLVVRVGNPAVFRISGHVMDSRAQPVAGSIVTAGSKSVFVDSDGSYTVPGLAAGSYTVSAREPLRNAVEFVHPFWNNPVALGPNAQNINFIVGTGAPPSSIIGTNAIWRFVDNGTNLGTAWVAADFDDTGWGSGPSQLGYGEGDEATTNSFGPSSANKYITTYYRHHFNVTDPGSLTNLIMNLLRDDGVAVYLNGIEVFRDNLAAGATYTTLATANAGDDGKTFLTANISPTLLVAGDNVIAAEIHQDAVDSSDITFYLALDGVAAGNVARAAEVYVASPSDNAAFTSPTNLTITAIANSTPNAVTNVDIYDGATRLGSFASPPYAAALNNPADGLHALVAVSFDSTGLRRTSAVVNITVSAPVPPSVSLSLSSTGSVWSYWFTNVGATAGWQAPAFNAAAWRTGPARLGFNSGNTGLGTILSGDTSVARFPAAYFRRAFVVNDPASITNLTLQLARDDGAVVYLNGVEILRDNITNGVTPAYSMLASNAADNGGTYYTFNVPPGGLVAGTNVVAAEVHQSSLTSSDLIFDLGLAALASTNRSRGCWLVAPANGAVIPLPGGATLTAEAVAGGTLGVSSIAFYSDGVLLGQDASAPFSFVWNNPPSGAHTLTAVAVDSSGGSVTSAPVNITVSSAPPGDALVSFGDVWKYLDDGSDQGTAWRAAAFNDSGWSSGPAQLGYGDGDELTTVSYGTNSSFRYITTWFRKKFVVSNPAQYSGLLLRLIRDDGAVVYLNGSEIYRTNLLAGPVSYNSLALSAVGGADESTPIDVALSTAGLLAGTNTLAVEIHQDSITSSDISFDLALIGQRGTNVTQGIYLTSPGAGAHFNLPASVPLAAHGASSGGAISLVEYFSDAGLVGSAAAPPYAVNWNGATSGVHVLTAVATYGAGLKMTSPPVVINVTPAPALIAPAYSTFISLGSVWHYWDSAAAAGSNWQGLAFDDSSWPTGNGRFGWGIDGESTLLTQRTTHYFRRSFVLTNGGALESLTFNVVRDDGVVVYLNGLEVFRTNMPAGPVDASTLASATINTPDETIPVEYTLTAPLAGLRFGTNVVAVELHQSSAASSDGGFDLSLHGQGTTEARVYVSSPLNGANQTVGQPVAVEAQAQAGTGRSLTNVEFYADGVKFGEAAAAPFQTTWATPPAGAHLLSARSVDNLGVAVTSAPVQINVGFPVVSLTLVPSNSVWRYLDNGSNQGTNWSQTNFNDSAWSSGPARLGYGGDGEETSVSPGPLALKYTNTYFRHAFVVPSNTYITNLVFRLVRDDGAVVHLNGREMYRSNMPAGPVTSMTLATAAVSGADEQTFFVTSMATNLGPGANILGVEIHQNAGNSSDLGFDLQLEGTGYVVVPTNAPAPVASNDFYTAVLGGNLDVAPPGVLANDVPVPLTAVLESGPAFGGLSLAANGSFVYSPAGTGVVSFTYRAVSGGATSAVATVTINVVPTPFVAASSFSGGALQIIWPTNAPGYRLYWSPVIGPGAVWSLVGGAPGVSNAFYLQSIPATNPAAFYQLRNP